MPKGKPWTKAEIKKLQSLLENGKSLEVIAANLGKSRQAVYLKARRLGLRSKEEGEAAKLSPSSTAELIMPEEFISVEDALKKLVAAMNALEEPGLSRTDVMRLRALIQTSGLYQKRLAEYMQYRQIEAKVDKVIEKLQRLEKEKSYGYASNRFFACMVSAAPLS